MQPLTNDPAPDWAPAWSPDGSEIAFYSGRSGNRDIFVVPSGGGPLRQLTTHSRSRFDACVVSRRAAIAYTRSGTAITTSG